MDTQENAVKVTLPAIPPVVIGLVVGLAVGLVGGYFIPRIQQGTSQTQQSQSGAQTAQTEPTGFYGKVASVNGTTFTVSELVGANKPGARTYTVTTNADTKYTYQKSSETKDASQPPFTPVDGKLADIQKDWFVYVSASAPLSGENATAAQVIYSDKSPFKE